MFHESTGILAAPPSSCQAAGTFTDPRELGAAEARDTPVKAAEWEVRALLARDLVSRAARLLAESGLLLAPLKGVLLAAAAPDRPLGRPLTDADVLVGPRALRRAAAALERGGFRRLASDAVSVTLALPGEPLALDLHGELFPAGMFGLDAAGVLARARLDGERFGAPVLWPRGDDAFAHLVGHFVKGRHGPGDRLRAEDFQRAATRLALEPGAVARHLAAQGLARAARRALGVAVALGDAPFAAAVLRALPPDPLGERLAGLASRWADAPRGLGAAVAPHLLDRSLPAGALSLLRRGVGSARRRLGARAR